MAERHVHGPLAADELRTALASTEQGLANLAGFEPVFAARVRPHLEGSQVRLTAAVHDWMRHERTACLVSPARRHS